MKIVSLQSAGLGAVFSGVNEPYTITVGENLYNGRGYSLGVTVTKIGFGDMYDGMELPKQDDTYFVYTSDGHIRVLPADKYIAERSEWLCERLSLECGITKIIISGVKVEVYRLYP